MAGMRLWKCGQFERKTSLTLLAVNHALPGHSISTEQVEIIFPNGPEPATELYPAH